MLQVVIFHATNPDTPFVVTDTSFTDLIDKTDDEFEAMKFSRSNSSKNSQMERELHVSILGLKLFP